MSEYPEWITQVLGEPRSNFTACHRCHKAYETLRYVPNIRIVEYHHGYGDETYQLCPDCQKQLEEWVEECNE